MLGKFQHHLCLLQLLHCPFRWVKTSYFVSVLNTVEPQCANKMNLLSNHWFKTPTFSQSKLIPTVGPSCPKMIITTFEGDPFIIFHHFKPLVSEGWVHGLIITFAECTMVVGLCKELLVRTWNYTYPNFHTMISCPKSRCVHISSLKKPPPLRFFFCKWVVAYWRFQFILNLLHVFKMLPLGHNNCFTL